MLTVILIWFACGLAFSFGWVAHARVTKRRLASSIGPPKVEIVDLTEPAKGRGQSVGHTLHQTTDR